MNKLGEGCRDRIPAALHAFRDRPPSSRVRLTEDPVPAVKPASRPGTPRHTRSSAPTGERGWPRRIRSGWWPDARSFRRWLRSPNNAAPHSPRPPGQQGNKASARAAQGAQDGALPQAERIPGAGWGGGGQDHRDPSHRFCLETAGWLGGPPGEDASYQQKHFHKPLPGKRQETYLQVSDPTARQNESIHGRRRGRESSEPGRSTPSNPQEGSGAPAPGPPLHPRSASCGPASACARTRGEDAEVTGRGSQGRVPGSGSGGRTVPAGAEGPWDPWDPGEGIPPPRSRRAPRRDASPSLAAHRQRQPGFPPEPLCQVRGWGAKPKANPPSASGVQVCRAQGA